MKKPDIERNHTEKFLSKEGIAYKLLEIFKEDPPDFILITNTENRIGIEHTRLMVENGKEIRSEIEIKEKVIKSAQNFYEKSDLPPVIVRFKFRGRLTINKKDIDKTGEKLFQIVADNIPVLKENDKNETRLLKNNLPEFIYEIRITRYKRHTKSLWDRPGIVWSSSMPKHILIETIEKKNKRLLETSYYKNFDETWLLLVIEGREWSEFATLKPDNFTLNNDWKFDRIYVYSLFDNEIERIK